MGRKISRLPDKTVSNYYLALLDDVKISEKSIQND